MESITSIQENFNSRETAKILGLKRKTIQNYLYKGKISSSKVNSQRVFTLSDIEKFKEKRKERSREQKRRTQIAFSPKIPFKREKHFIDNWQLHIDDSSSSDVQIGFLTLEIQQIEEKLHMQRNDPIAFKENRLLLIGHTAKRRKLLEYLKNTDTPRYQRAIIKIKKMNTCPMAI